MLRRARQFLIRFAFLSFAFRALVPVGFMPAALADGGPFKICHGGVAGALFSALAERTHGAHSGHSAHHHHAQAAAGDALGSGDELPAGHAGWEHCPVGAAVAQAAITSAGIHFEPVPHEQAFARIEPRALVARVIPSVYRARAPPIA